MKVNVVRGKPTNDGTPGRWTDANGWECDTLELPWANNEKGRSCIIADTYAAKLWHSDHLGRDVYRLEDKHGRADCLVHNGTFAGEVNAGEETQVHGCTEVGRGYALVDRTDGKKDANGNPARQYGILHSKDTLAALIEATGGEDLEITYSWAEGCEPERSDT